MIESVANVCLVVLGTSLVAALYRVLRGPTIADRVAATDLLTTCIMAIVATAGILVRSHVFIVVVMAIALLGFFGTVAFSKYLLGGRAIE